MVTLLKILIVLLAFSLFFYGLGLAFQGKLEMQIILKDLVTLKEYIRIFFK